MLNLLHARSFLAVLDRRGFRAAARDLQLSPSTVVEHINQLETELSAHLLVRRRRGFALTPQGAAFVPLARGLLATAERARETIASSPLRIAAATNVGVYMLLSVLAAYQRVDPRPTELWIGGNPAVADRLRDGRADIALTEWWDDRPGFRVRTWRREPLVLIVGPAHPWASRKGVAVMDLVGLRMLGGEAGTGTGTLLRRTVGPLADRIEIVNGFGSTEGVKRAVRAGLGVSLVIASSVTDEVMAGDLVALPLVDADLVKDIRLVVPDALPGGSAAARFAEYAVSRE